MSLNIKKGIYRHYKDKDYEVFCVALHSETLEPLVVYRSLYANDMSEYWVRPYAMFTEEIMHAGKRVPRFRYIGPATALQD
ncbi:MAG: DUF1653 domain-containing protein [Candidatus Thioglobus sp.]